MANYCFCSFAFVISLLAGCHHSHEETEAQHASGGSVTIWTSKTELFMEYPALIVGQEIRFAVHLTWLSDFKPVTDGTLSLVFASTDGARHTTVADKPTSPGIYRPTTTFDRPGTYHLTMIIDGVSRDTLHVDGLHVFASVADIPPDEKPSTGEQLVTFLKEQQWKIDFHTEPVVRKPMSGSVRAACEIVPRLNSEAIVSAPFTGTIPLEENQSLPVVGQQVGLGARLAIMIPSAEPPSGIENFSSRFIEAETDRALAEKELERAKRLRAIDGVSEREYQEAETTFKRADATYQTLNKYVHSNRSGQSPNSFTLSAPLSGTIVEAYVVPGKQVNAGEQLYRIINTSMVWARANVASTEIGKLARPRRAWLQIAGANEAIELNERNGRLVSIATAIDQTTRTFPVIFEIRNPDGKLRVGMFGEINIATGRETEAIVIPESALIEEEGKFSAYVHVEGEAFAKRELTLGERNGAHVEVRNGLSEGERVVTVGAYQVRLASLTSQLPAHGHEH